MKRSTIQARAEANKLRDQEISMWLERGGRNCYEQLMRMATPEVQEWLRAAGSDFVWGDR